MATTTINKKASHTQKLSQQQQIKIKSHKQSTIIIL